MKVLGYITFFLPFLTAWFGFELIYYKANKKINTLDMIGAAYPVGMMFSVLISLILNQILGLTLIHLIIHIATISFIAFKLHFINKKHQFKQIHLKLLLIISIIVHALLSIVLIQTIFPEKGEISADGNQLMQLEFSLIASFVKGINKWRGMITPFHNPLYYKFKIYSDYIPPFYCALMKIGGVPITFSIQIQTFYLFISAFLLQYSLTFRLTKSVIISIFSAFTIFLTGGFGFYNWTDDHNRINRKVDYVHVLSRTQSMFWGHPMRECFLTSRVASNSLCLSIFMYILMENDDYLCAGIALILNSLNRPQNGFIAMIIYLFYCNDFEKFLNAIKFGSFMLSRVKLAFKNAKIRAIMAAANFSIYFITNIDFTKGSYPMWKDCTNSALPFISFWIACYGVHFYGYILSISKKNLTNIFLIAFIYRFCCLYTLQPYHRQNFVIILCVLSPIIISYSFKGFSRFLNRIRNEEAKGAYLSVIFFVFIFGILSASMGLYQNNNKPIERYTDNETEVVEWVVANTSMNSVFHGKLDINWNPILTKAGRQFIYVNNTLAQFLIDDFDSNFNLIKRIDFSNFTYPYMDYIMFYAAHPNTNQFRTNLKKALKEVFSNDMYVIFQNIAKLNETSKK